MTSQLAFLPVMKIFENLMRAESSFLYFKEKSLKHLRTYNILHAIAGISPQNPSLGPCECVDTGLRAMSQFSTK